MKLHKLSILVILAGFTFSLSAQCWNLVFEDNFDGTSLDLTKWNYQTGAGGWGNNELQYYTDRTDNVSVSGGYLSITALEESYMGASYTSGRIRTKNKGDWTYGRMEARIRIPETQGIWPAFWMLPTNNIYGGWPASGEIDIMEAVGHIPETYFTSLHYRTSGDHQYQSTSYTLPVGDFADDYHVFSIIWQENNIEWFVDGTSVFEIQNTDIAPYQWVFDQDFHFLLNVAVGGDWPGVPDATTIFPQSMSVDYVRVYQWVENISMNGEDYLIAGTGGHVYSLPEISGSTYTWSVPGDMLINSGQGTPSITVTAGSTGGNITCTLNNACGSQDYTMPVTVSTNYWPNYNFEDDYNHWHTRVDNGGVANFLITNVNAQEGSASTHVNVTTVGTQNWDIQLSRDDVPLENGVDYSLSFWAKSNVPGQPLPVAFINASDYSWIAGTTFSLSTSWANYTLNFTASDTEAARFNIDMGGQVGQYYFDDFYFSQTALLPVSYSYFDVDPIAPKKVLIKWGTLSELNNKEFVIEHSLDSRSFKALATIKAQPGAYTQQAYQYIHDTPLESWNYYRLKDIDIAGNFKYSPIRSAYIELANHNIYPNPAREHLFIKCDVSVWCNIYDVFGRLVNRQLLAPVNGVALISASQLTAGNYIIKVDGSNHAWHFTKVKK